MKKRSNLTMAAIVARVEAGPPARPDPNAQPGGFNRLGQFFDPKGRRLECSKKEITPQQALALVESGADVAFEGCGCGGWTGCQPSWFDPHHRKMMTESGPPRFVRGHNSPTFIDVWASADSTVVFLHGAVQWAELLP